MGQFASLTDVKAHINSTSAVNDDELTLMLDAAEERVASLVGSFDAVAVTERVTAHGGEVVLSRRPIGAVVLNGGDVTGFTTSAGAGVLYGVPFTYDPLTATYTAGDGAVPASVTLATAIITAHLWESQRGPAQSPVAQQQQFDEGLPFGGLPVSYAIPNRAKELLEPYLRNTQVA